MEGPMNGDRWTIMGREIEGPHLLVIASPGTGKRQGSGPALGGLRWRLRKLAHRAFLARVRRR